MRKFWKAVEYNIAMHNKCYWCILREYQRFDCEFNQGIYFDYPCSKEDYKRCPYHREGEQIRKERGW